MGTGSPAVKAERLIISLAAGIILVGIASVSADITQSGQVEMDNFSGVAAQWLCVPGMPNADIAPADGDGVGDLLTLADNWLAAD